MTRSFTNTLFIYVTHRKTQKWRTLASGNSLGEVARSGALLPTFPFFRISDAMDFKTGAV
ncbi:MAG: hypothetical protein VB878_00505 [Pirellulaceae bacterium]